MEVGAPAVPIRCQDVVENYKEMQIDYYGNFQDIDHFLNKINQSL